MEKSRKDFYREYTQKNITRIKPNIVFVLKVSEKSSSARLKKERLKIDMIILQNPFMQKHKNPL